MYFLNTSGFEWVQLFVERTFRPVHRKVENKNKPLTTFGEGLNKYRGVRLKSPVGREFLALKGGGGIYAACRQTLSTGGFEELLKPMVENRLLTGRGIYAT